MDQNEAAAAPRPKSYSAGFRVPGRWAYPLHPLGRLSITSDGITLSRRLIPWPPPLQVRREDVTQVVLSVGWFVTTLTIDDAQHILDGVRVELKANSGRVRRTLLANGYPVLAYDRWLFLRLRKTGWQRPPDRTST